MRAAGIEGELHRAAPASFSRTTSPGEHGQWGRVVESVPPRRLGSVTRSLPGAVALALALAACSPQAPTGTVSDLARTTPAEMLALLEGSDRPVVLNVWASWCAPCRAEAPLLRAAHRQHGDRVTFLGVAVRDSPDGARRFLEEFSLGGFTHVLDPTGSVPAALGGRGVPLTFFYAPGGELVHLHGGVLDERTLALLIDEISR
jgi:cytochrome c biogenesis protein CcmG, thiol:disulfide interchange protein DsbE